MTREEKAYNYASKKNPSKYTVNEIIKHYDDGYKEGWQDAVDKVCEFLWDCGYIDTFAIDEVIDKFKKYMEEKQ